VVVEPWVMYLLIVSSVVAGGLVGCAALLLGHELRGRRMDTIVVVDGRDGRPDEPVVTLELSEDERGWLEAHGIDAG
jgi:hypothetical protein